MGSIARTTLKTTAVFGLRFVVQAATLLLVAYALGPDAYGAFAGVIGLAVFLGSLAGFGMPLLQLRASAAGPGKQHGALPYAFPAVLLSGFLLLAIYVPLCLYLFPSARLGAGLLFAFGFSELIVQPLLVLFASMRHGAGEVVRSQLLQLMPLFLRAVAAGAVVMLAPASPLLWYCWAYVLAALASFTVAWNGMAVAGFRSWRLPQGAEWRQAFGFAAAEVSRNGPTELDKSVAMRFLGGSDAGLYAAGSRIVAAFVLPVMAMVVSSLPRLFREADGEYVPIRLIVAMLASSCIYGAIMALLLWLGAPRIDGLFGAAYAGIGGIVGAMCMVVPGLSLRLVSGYVLMVLGRVWWRVGVEFLGVFLMVFFGYFLMPEVGVTGMVYALAFSEWGMVFCSLLVIGIDLFKVRGPRDGGLMGRRGDGNRS
ncbi:hypothetical protein ABB30_12980 [Stenotrophomonas ginsengisoli]|uniref:Polysaccharide biosynthesis protein n=1 Tax=Stenotrophomonas ginsengisoli TaxID=336566 RepID=A0A0R0DDA1_9GAMM|nr:lipopolysaccharide biosynthesis protein [Stenotrophomonas ginsengisoli]KRG75016.1 hypothetical protein ABB30_12980 [Stenotrophomonas ginsengisoli]